MCKNRAIFNGVRHRKIVAAILFTLCIISWFSNIKENALTLFASGNPVLEIPFGSTFNPIDFDYIVIDIGVVFAGYMEFSGVFGELIISGEYRLQDGRTYRICVTNMEIDGNHIAGSH